MPCREWAADEWLLLVSLGTAGLFLLYGHSCCALSNPIRLGAILGWLLLVIILSAFAVLRHAERMAVSSGSPWEPSVSHCP